MSRQTTDTKERILKAAGTLYSVHGPDGTTLDDIITSAGITKGAFYHYFKTKESLSDKLIDMVISEYQQLALSIDSEQEPIGQLRQIIQKIIDLNASGQWINCRLILRFSADSHELQPQIQQRIQKFWQWYTGFYEELIQKCRDTGQFGTQLDVQTQARILISIMAGTVILEKASPTSPKLGDLAGAIVSLLRA